MRLQKWKFRLLSFTIALIQILMLLPVSNIRVYAVDGIETDLSDDADDENDVSDEEIDEDIPESDDDNDADIPEDDESDDDSDAGIPEDSESDDDSDADIPEDSESNDDNDADIPEDDENDVSDEDEGLVAYAEPVTYTLTVVDEFYEADGKTLIQSEEREEKTYAEGDSYYFGSLPNPIIWGYFDLEFVPIGSSSYSGVVSEDMTLVFKYAVAVEDKFVITVVDEFYESDGTTLIKSEERKKKTYAEGAYYEFNALPDAFDRGFYEGNTPTYSGFVSKDMTLVFTYVSMVEARFVITVVDEYYESDGKTLIKAVERESESYAKGANYGFGALTDINAEGFYVEKIYRYDGVVSKDMTLVFKYVFYDENEPIVPDPTLPEYKVTVVDEYYKADGKTLIKSVERESKIFTAGDYYSFFILYDVLNEGFRDVIGVQSGAVYSDMTIVFKYISLAKDKFVLTVVDEFYETDQKTLIKVVERESNTYTEGDRYAIFSLQDIYDEYYLLRGNVYAGVVSEDMNLVFKYAKIEGTEPDPSPQPDPKPEDDPNPKPEDKPNTEPDQKPEGNPSSTPVSKPVDNTNHTPAQQVEENSNQAVDEGSLVETPEEEVVAERVAIDSQPKTGDLDEMDYSFCYIPMIWGMCVVYLVKKRKYRK